MEQRSTVQMGALTRVVHSQLVMEPEPMVVTRLLDEDGHELDKQHAAVPAAAAADFLGRGSRALVLFLQSSHLCFVQRLLWSPRQVRPPTQVAPRVGVLGTQVFDRQGHVVLGMGEDQVSGNWLQISYLLVGLVEKVGSSLELGPCRRAVATGQGIAAIVLEDGDTKVFYVDPDEISVSAAAPLEAREAAI